MREEIIKCDVCGGKVDYAKEFKFEGYISPTQYGLLFNTIEDCCTQCAQSLIECLRDAFNKKVEILKQNRGIRR
jgi:hypothetical protein